jgi:hypothetical protein
VTIATAVDPFVAQKALVDQLDKSGWDLIIGDAFVRGMRGIGYKSTSYALFELIGQLDPGERDLGGGDLLREGAPAQALHGCDQREGPEAAGQVNQDKAGRPHQVGWRK